MGKYFLLLLVIIPFIAYSLTQSKSQALPTLTPPSSSSQNTSQPTLSLTTPTPSATPPQPTPQISPPSPVATPTETPNPTPTANGYKDGTYTGQSADAFYGYIQVQAKIQGGKITNISFLQYPNDRSTSIFINQQADPLLAQEAIQSQGANVDIVSGATDSSQAFTQSLQSALDQAKS